MNLVFVFLLYLLVHQGKTVADLALPHLDKDNLLLIDRSCRIFIIKLRIMLPQHLITVHPADLLSARTVHLPQCPVWNGLLNRLKYDRFLEFLKQDFQHRFSLSPHVKYIESIVSLHFRHNGSYTAPGTRIVSPHTHPPARLAQPQL